MTSEPTSYSLSFLQSSENTSCTLVSVVLLHACTKSEASRFGHIFRCFAFVNWVISLASQQLANSPQKSLAVLRDQTVQPSVTRLMFWCWGDITHFWGEPTTLVFQYMLGFFNLLYIKSILVLCELYLLCSTIFVNIAVETPELRNAVLLLFRPHQATQWGHRECLHSDGASWGRTVIWVSLLPSK